MDINTVIDLPWLESATLDDLKTAMRQPHMLASVNALLQTPEGKTIAQDMLNDPDYIPKSKRQPTQEELEQIALDTQRAEDQARTDEEVLAAQHAEAALNPPAPVTPPEERKKVVVDYQVTAEDGTPIGRPTHIEGWDHAEVVEKLKNAHTHAVRYAERVKRNKIQSVESSTQQQQRTAQVQRLETEAQEAIAAAGKDPAKLVDAVKKVSAAEREAEAQKQAALAEGRAIADVWKADHTDDFVPCEANSKFIGDWLVKNNRELSYENLELAYTATRHQLVKPVEEPIAAVASNVQPPAPAVVVADPPSITAPVAPAAAPVLNAAVQPVQPAPTATVPTPAAAPIAQPAARRPGVNGSLPPGTLTAVRPRIDRGPVVSTKAEMMAEIDAMSPKEYRYKVEKSPEFRARLEAAGIPVLGQH